MLLTSIACLEAFCSVFVLRVVKLITVNEANELHKSAAAPGGQVDEAAARMWCHALLSNPRSDLTNPSFVSCQERTKMATKVLVRSMTHYRILTNC